MSKKAWIIFAAVVVIMFGGLIYLSGKDKIDVSNVDVNKITTASSQSGDIADHVFGKVDSKLVLIEYGDFQCPGCKQAQPVLETLSEKYKDQIAFVFRNFPLTTIHPNARVAAAAAEAAGLQGKYWEMHTLLYDNQDSWKSADTEQRNGIFEDYAKQLGLDATKFKAGLADVNVNKKISFDQALGKKLNLSGTPSIFFQGKVVDQYVKDGEFVAKGTDGSNPIWSDVDAFDKLLLIPALKEAGIELPAEPIVTATE